MKYTNKYNLPQALVDVIVGHTYDLSTSDPTRLSITKLNDAPRIRLLEIRHWNQLEEDVSEHIWRIVGNAYHYILAKTDPTHRLIEEKLEETLHGMLIVGKLDIYDSPTKSIDDWKVTSVWAMKFPKPDWERQLNCYAWLLHKLGFVVEKININAMLRDWSKTELMRYGGDYPLIPFKRLNVKLWSFEEQQKYMEERVLLHQGVMNLPDAELPLCSREERWAEDAKWAVYKNANKTALRVLGSEAEAKKYILELGETKDKLIIKERPGCDKRCMEYCGVNKFCDYYQKTYGDRKDERAKSEINTKKSVQGLGL